MHDNDPLSELDKTVLRGSELGVFNDLFGERLLNLYHHGICDSFVVKEIQERVRKAERRIAFSGCPLRMPQLHEGDFVFGYDINNKKIKIWRQQLNAGTLIVGNTGSGKTNVSKFGIIQIIPHPDTKGAFLIDMRKKEYRLMRPVFAKIGIDLKIIRSRRLRINPLQLPVAVGPEEYSALAADFITKSLNLPPRASILLRTTLMKLYIKAGVVQGCETYPCFHDLFAAVKADRNANPQARSAVLDSLESLLLDCGSMLAYHKGWDPGLLAKQFLAMEFFGMLDTSKDLILSYLLTSEFSSRINQGISNPKMDLFVAFDEAQRTFSKQKEASSNEGNSLLDLIGVTRGTGIGLQVSALAASGLAAGISNLTTKVIGRAGTWAEYEASGNLVALNDKEKAWAAHTLEPGCFIGQTSEGNFRYPFVFRVPLLEKLTKPDGETHVHVTDAEADKTIEAIENWRVLPAAV